MKDKYIDAINESEYLYSIKLSEELIDILDKINSLSTNIIKQPNESLILDLMNKYLEKTRAIQKYPKRLRGIISNQLKYYEINRSKHK